MHLFFLSGLVITSGSVSIESLNLIGCNNDTLSRSSLKLSTTFSPVFADVSSSGQSHDSQYSRTSSRFTFLESSVVRSCNREKHYCHCSLINHYCFSHEHACIYTVQGHRASAVLYVTFVIAMQLSLVVYINTFLCDVMQGGFGCKQMISVLIHSIQSFD